MVLLKVHQHSLRKHEILRKRQLVAQLFSIGKSARGDFLRIVYASLKSENRLGNGVSAILLFTAGKKKIPSAVKRNRVKRMMREAYRLERPLLPYNAGFLKDSETDGQLCISFLYIGSRETFPALEAFRKEIRELIGGMLPVWILMIGSIYGS